MSYPRHEEGNDVFDGEEQNNFQEEDEENMNENEEFDGEGENEYAQEAAPAIVEDEEGDDDFPEYANEHNKQLNQIVNTDYLDKII